MRILHLAWEFPPTVYGGLGRHIAALSAAQATAGHDVTVVTQGEGEDAWNGVRIVRVPTEPFPYHLPDLLTWVGTLDHRIGQAARSISTDVVHAHDWMVGRAGQVTAAAQGAPLVATVHATEAGRHSGWLPDVVSSSVHLVEGWLATEADGVIVCSQAMRREVCQAHGRCDATVIPNGIDLTTYSPRAARPQKSAQLTFVGRLEWEKGVFVAVDAMATVLQQRPDARLQMIGTGSQATALSQRIAQRGLGAAIDLRGHVDEPTLHTAYAQTDVLLVPSSYEPFGIVALEGAAMGIPLVVGDTGGLAEFVTDQRGRRFTPGDADHLAAQILAALNDPRGTAARARAAREALADYTWEVVAERTVEVYQDATPGTPGARRLLVADRHIW